MRTIEKAGGRRAGRRRAGSGREKETKIFEIFEIFETGTNGTEIFWEKFQEMRKFRDESQMERKFPGKKFRKFGFTSRACPLFRNLCKFPIFYSALASSFGRDHSELDISRKDDDDAHSIKETL